MCSIFGIILAENTTLSSESAYRLTQRLFRLSESRGKDAAGIALRTPSRITVDKRNLTASRFIRLPIFKDLFKKPHNGQQTTPPLSIIGHCRMATNGLPGLNRDNQPLVKNGMVGAHNGIIVNDGQLWVKHPDCQRRFNVDTEIFLSLYHKYRGQNLSPADCLRQIYSEIDGMTSIALMTDRDPRLILATNNGSLYTLIHAEHGLGLFASERIFLSKLTASPELKKIQIRNKIEPLLPMQAMLVNSFNLETFRFSLKKTKPETESPLAVKVAQTDITDISTEPALPPPAFIYDKTRFPEGVSPSHLGLRRCRKCILPATIPFIEFDREGICNYCRREQPKVLKGEAQLEREIAPYRTANGRHDCVVGFSGGRDSSYGLHYIKKILKLNPLAYSYDWGVITDLGRRNQSRLCGKLGVEHILIDAGIRRKLRNIRLNIAAWLKKPDLGTVPLLMAGDKPFYFYSGHLKKMHDLGLSIICSGNPYERAAFKSGFSGVRGRQWGKGNLTGMPTRDKFKLALYYARQCLVNPAYLNPSLLDTLYGFYASYLYQDDNLYLYDYIPWDEEQINRTLKEEYDWETAPDTKTTWRIGDGTAPFYNYIYYTLAGFTEFDSFRSRQIRSGALSREKALELIEHENQPRWDAMIWYAQRVGFDLEAAVRIINRAPKLYAG